jgi:hypothetical protein
VRDDFRVHDEILGQSRVVLVRRRRARSPRAHASTTARCAPAFELASARAIERVVASPCDANV